MISLCLCFFTTGCSFDLPFFNKSLPQNDVTTSSSTAQKKSTNTPVCTIDDDRCNTYYRLWKEMFRYTNELSDTYFLRHIRPKKIEFVSWQKSELFRITYSVSIDWFSLGYTDEFVIKIYDGQPGYEFLDIPRNIDLDKQNIQKIIDADIFSTQLHHVFIKEHLFFPSQEKALQVLAQEAGVEKFALQSLGFGIPGQDDPYFYPYLQGYGVVDGAKGQCVSGSVNLINGEIQLWKDVCMLQQ